MLVKSSMIQTACALAVCIGVFGSISPSFAGPRLVWWTITINGDKAECLRRANGTMITERVGKLQISKHDVVGGNESVTAFIRCVPCGIITNAFIAVAGSDADNLIRALESGVRSGGPYDESSISSPVKE